MKQTEKVQIQRAIVDEKNIALMKIEFRVWDKNKRKMLYLYPNDTILFKNGKCSVWKENQYDKFEECCCCEVYSNVIAMQYTGMKDKDGNKIYKADILKDTLDNLYIVDFIRGCFYLKTRYEKNGEWLEWLPMSEITQLAEPENFYRIGNIYENPELLA